MRTSSEEEEGSRTTTTTVPSLSNGYENSSHSTNCTNETSHSTLCTNGTSSSPADETNSSNGLTSNGTSCTTEETKTSQMTSSPNETKTSQMTSSPNETRCSQMTSSPNETKCSQMTSSTEEETKSSQLTSSPLSANETSDNKTTNENVTNMTSVTSESVVTNGTIERIGMGEKDYCGEVPFSLMLNERVLGGAETSEGRVLVTNYRLYIQAAAALHNIPIGLVESFEIKELFFLHVSCKDARYLRITFPNNESLSELVRTLHTAIPPPKSLDSSFALHFYKRRSELSEESCLELGLGQLSPRQNAKDRFWSEVHRMGFNVSNPWRVSYENEEWELCSSYPRLLIIPNSIDKKKLEQVACFRSARRFPTVVWRHQGNGAVICRCSQPEVGWFGWRSTEDEELVQNILQAASFSSPSPPPPPPPHPPQSNNVINNVNNVNISTNETPPPPPQFNNNQIGPSYNSSPPPSPSPPPPLSMSTTSLGMELLPTPSTPLKKLLILDARSYTTAVANRARGGGCECLEYYPNCEIQFMNLANIHSIRKSFIQLRQLSASPPENTWYSQLEGSKWIQHMCGLMKAAVAVVTAVETHGRPVMVHCSDGWDRTPQIVSLAEILLDPYYRSFEGFEVLVEREWLEFGHKFGDRCGQGVGSDDSNERCPVFLQWLDCLHQLLTQFPTAFEFNISFLLKLLLHTYSNLFGTFLCNTAKERESLGMRERGMSVWNYLCSPTNYSKFRNSLYQPQQKVLWPSCEVRDMKYWSQVYLGHDTHSTPPPPPNSSSDNVTNPSSNSTNSTSTNVTNPSSNSTNSTSTNVTNPSSNSTNSSHSTSSNATNPSSNYTNSSSSNVTNSTSNSRNGGDVTSGMNGLRGRWSSYEHLPHLTSSTNVNANSTIGTHSSPHKKGHGRKHSDSSIYGSFELTEGEILLKEALSEIETGINRKEENFKKRNETESSSDERIEEELLKNCQIHEKYNDFTTTSGLNQKSIESSTDTIIGDTIVKNDVDFEEEEEECLRCEESRALLKSPIFSPAASSLLSLLTHSNFTTNSTHSTTKSTSSNITNSNSSNITNSTSSNITNSTSSNITSRSSNGGHVDGFPHYTDETQLRVHSLLSECHALVEMVQRENQALRVALREQICHRCNHHSTHHPQNIHHNYTSSHQSHNYTTDDSCEGGGGGGEVEVGSLGSDGSSFETVDERDVYPPKWVPDFAVTHCMGCFVKFSSISRRKHHCRACGRVYCYECSENSIILPDEQIFVPSRVCRQCYAKHTENPSKNSNYYLKKQTNGHLEESPSNSSSNTHTTHLSH